VIMCVVIRDAQSDDSLQPDREHQVCVCQLRWWMFKVIYFVKCGHQTARTSLREPGPRERRTEPGMLLDLSTMFVLCTIY